jgi:hypothetical protein
MTIFKIIYRSQIVPGDVRDFESSIDSILQWSRSWNAKHAITGALMMNENTFSQVLEGPADAVKCLFGHIACDGRHRNVQLLQSGLFEKRDFGNWAMAYAGPATEADIMLASTSRLNEVSVSASEDADSVVALLRWLLREDRPAIGER